MLRNAVLVLALSSLTLPVSAQIVQVTEPAQLNASTTANFVDPVGAVYVFGQVVPNTAGDQITFRAGGESLRRVNQGNGFEGTFASGTPLLFAPSVFGPGGSVVTEGGPITFTFPVPVISFGVLAQTEGVGLEQYTLSAFSGTDLLATIAVGIDSTVNPSNPAFLGFQTTDVGLAVDRIVLSTNLGNSFVIAAPSFTVVPSPATAGLLVLAGAVAARRRR